MTKLLRNTVSLSCPNCTLVHFDTKKTPYDLLRHSDFLSSSLTAYCLPNITFFSISCTCSFYILNKGMGDMCVCVCVCVCVCLYKERERERERETDRESMFVSAYCCSFGRTLTNPGCKQTASFDLCL